MPEAKESEKVVPSLSEDNFEDEFFQIFLDEINEFLGIYEVALHNIQNNIKDKESNYKEIFRVRSIEKNYRELFRVWHTLKGDSAFFPRLKKMTDFLSIKCDQMRSIDQSEFNNPVLINNITLNLNRLRNFYNALKNELSIDDLDYKIYI